MTQVNDVFASIARLARAEDPAIAFGAVRADDGLLEPVLVRARSADAVTIEGTVSPVGRTVSLLLRNVGWVEGIVRSADGRGCELSIIADIDRIELPLAA
ncbi:MAG: hypothetical protein JF593_13215 [Novosphingobium sp.]|nr:hypothetical protein [Novosphingobium sp.]